MEELEKKVPILGDALLNLRAPIIYLLTYLRTSVLLPLVAWVTPRHDVSQCLGDTLTTCS